MGNAFTMHEYRLTPEEIKEVRKETGFTKTQVRRLFSRFHHLDKEGKGFLTRDDLMLVTEIALNPLGERVVEMFFTSDDDKYLYFADFARTFSVFRPVKESTAASAKNSREEKLKLLFQSIDVHRNGYFNKEDMHDLLEQMMGVKVGEDQLWQIASRIVNEADLSGEGTVTLEEFKEATKDLDVANRMSFISFN